MICKCCNHTFDEFETDEICPHCGFENIETWDVAGETRVQEIANAYRETYAYREAVISHLSHISVFANTYTWPESKNSFKSTGHRDLFADARTDGRACYEKPVFSKEWIAHFEGEEKIDVSYKYGGVDKTLSSKVKIKPSIGFWHIGLHINDSLRLEILLGVEPVGSGKIETTYVLDTMDLDFSV